MPNCPAGGLHRCRKLACQTMCVTGNTAQPFRPMPDRIESGHHCQQYLRGADVRCGLVPADMLFACLQCQPVSHAPGAVLTDTDQPPRNCALIFGKRRKESGVRPAIPKRHTKALGRSQNNIGTKRARGFQQCQRQQITCHDGQTAHSMNRLNIRSDIAHSTAAAGIADQRAKNTFITGCRRRGNINGNAKRLCPGAQNCQCLRMCVRVDPEHLSLAAMCPKRHCHGLGGGRGLIKQ